MGYTKKTIEEMDCMDDFFMNAVAEDPEVGEAFCRRLLSVLLRRNMGKIRVRVQHALQGETPDRKGIRLDVEAEEPAEGEENRLERVYDIEPHLRNGVDLPRHNRFYQARIDSRHLERGTKDYSRLPDLYVITILNFDPFGYGRMMYTIENRCVEEGDLEYPDGLQFLYFYAGGKKGGSEEIGTLLRYLLNSREENAVDDATRELHGYVSRVKVKPEVKDRLMDFEEYVWMLKRETEKETAERVEKETAERVMRENTVENILELLEDYGEIPEDLRQGLAQIRDIDLLKRCLKFAGKVDSIEEYVVRCKELFSRELPQSALKGKNNSH